MNDQLHETVLAIHSLTKNSMTTNYRALAAKLDLSLAATSKRLDRLERLGVIPPRPRYQQNTVRLDPSVVVHKKQIYQLRRIP